MLPDRCVDFLRVRLFSYTASSGTEFVTLIIFCDMNFSEGRRLVSFLVDSAEVSLGSGTISPPLLSLLRH